MKRFNLISLVVLAAAFGLGALPAQAQTTGRPIVVKQPKPRLWKFKGEVIHANRLQITVRSRNNERVIQTFRLSEELQEKMQKIIDKGGYQYGDKVEIHHGEGSDVALKIKGKPSKPKS